MSQKRACYQSFVHPVDQSNYIGQLQKTLDEFSENKEAGHHGAGAQFFLVAKDIEAKLDSVAGLAAAISAARCRSHPTGDTIAGSALLAGHSYQWSICSAPSRDFLGAGLKSVPRV